MRATRTAAYRAWLPSYWLEGLPAALLVAALGSGADLRLGVVVARRVWRGGPVVWRSHLRRWLRCQTAAVGLICLAALIEGTISHV